MLFGDFWLIIVLSSMYEECLCVRANDVILCLSMLPILAHCSMALEVQRSLFSYYIFAADLRI